DRPGADPFRVRVRWRDLRYSADMCHQNVETPRRHPARPLNIGGAGAVAKALRIKAPDAAQWELIGRDLLVGDPLSDELVDWMIATGTKQTRPLFDQALAQGIDSVPDAPAPLKKFFDVVEQDPPWLDRERIRR